ncbi:MAG TPA: hypothetical protein VE263_05320 [Candidatus Angelobacter sp.]|nr:hypothetical protein [Candidatus Angelobacter sp.]
MAVLKYLLTILGVGLFGSATALAAYDIYLSMQLQHLLRRKAAARRSARILLYKIGFSGSHAGHGLR